MNLHQFLRSDSQRPSLFEDIYRPAWDVNSGGLLGNNSIQGRAQPSPTAVLVTAVYGRSSCASHSGQRASVLRRPAENAERQAGRNHRETRWNDDSPGPSHDAENLERLPDEIAA